MSVVSQPKVALIPFPSVHQSDPVLFSTSLWSNLFDQRWIEFCWFHLPAHLRLSLLGSFAVNTADASPFPQRSLRGGSVGAVLSDLSSRATAGGLHLHLRVSVHLSGILWQVEGSIVWWVMGEVGTRGLREFWYGRHVCGLERLRWCLRVRYGSGSVRVYSLCS